MLCVGPEVLRGALEQPESPGGSREPRKEEPRVPASTPAPRSVSPARLEGASRLRPGLPWSDATSRCVIHRRVQELHGRGGWGLATSPWQQCPVMWDVSCSGLGKLGQALRSFGPQQPRQGGSLRDVSFQKHGAATHGKGHTGPTGGKGGKLAWLTSAGSYSRASGKSRLLPRKDVSPCSRLCFSPSPPRAVRLRSRPHDVRCEGALRRGRRD